MAFWIENYFLCLFVSVVLAGILIPNIITIAFKRKLFDEIDERKIHQGAVPRLGGISFMPAFIFSFFLIIGCDIRLDVGGQHEVLESAMEYIRFLLCSLMLMYLVGIADDLMGVRYRDKFLLQIIAGSLFVLSGCWIMDFYGFAGIDSLPDVAGWIVTVFLVIYVVNAINLIDGIDGLASGLSTIALVFYSIVFFQGGEYIFSLVAAATAGTLFPFFYYNVFGDPNKQKKIFMGDTGALTTGMVLVFCAIAVMSARPDFLNVDYNPAMVALSPLIIPCFDVFRVYFHRVRHHRNPFLPDKCHIHHKLLALGFNQAAALMLILGASVAFIGINVLLSPYVNPTLLLILDVLIWTCGNMGLTKAIRIRERKTGKVLYE